MVKKTLTLIFSTVMILGCDSPTKVSQLDNTNVDSSTISVNTDTIVQELEPEEPLYISDTSFVNIEDIVEDISLNFVYADTANFLKAAVYPCEECLLRHEVAMALKDVSIYLDSLGYKLELMDCYRPLSVQKLMWEVLPNARYVANPNKSGSIHNRGGAVDLRLLYKHNNDTVPMGTKFDHFGKEAAHTYTNLPQEVLNNRLILKNAMKKFGFNAIKSEWWHYSYWKASQYPIADFSLKCE